MTRGEGGGGMHSDKGLFEPVHEISNNVAFWHVKTQTSLCSPILRLETQNGVQSVAKQS